MTLDNIKRLVGFAGIPDDMLDTVPNSAERAIMAESDEFANEFAAEREEYENQMYYGKKYCVPHQLDFSQLPCTQCPLPDCFAVDCPKCDEEEAARNAIDEMNPFVSDLL